MIVPTLTRHCNSGAYPALLRASYVGGLIDLLAHRPLAWQTGYRQGGQADREFPGGLKAGWGPAFILVGAEGRGDGVAAVGALGKAYPGSARQVETRSPIRSASASIPR